MPLRTAQLPSGFECAGFVRTCAAACLAWIALTGPSSAADELVERTLKANANGALAVLGLSVVPNETASTISLDTASGDTPFRASQLGGAFTVSDELPLYLEGFLGIARYDPKYVFAMDGDSAVVSPHWSSIAGTVGLGWDIRLADELVLRPIANVSLGHVESDVSLVGRLVPLGSAAEGRFLDNGRLDAYGYGGSLMLDWERYREDYEIDVELRYTHIRLESFESSSDIVEGRADAITLGLWSRLRVPTGWTAFDRPLRGVGEFAFGVFGGDQKDALDSSVLGQLGGGIEFDFDQVSWLPVERTRLMGRYLFGRDLTGFSFGIGISF